MHVIFKSSDIREAHSSATGENEILLRSSTNMEGSTSLLIFILVHCIIQSQQDRIFLQEAHQIVN